MFQGLRKNAKLVIYIVAAVFILSMAIGGISSIFTSHPYLAEIAGQKITYTEYNELLKNSYANYIQQNPETEITDQIMKQINEDTWSQLVGKILYDREIKRRKIKVTEEDVLEKLKNPGEDITSIPDFQTDGKFDYNKYESLLLENPDFANYLERRYTESLPYEKLFDSVKAEVSVTEEEVKEDYIKKNNKADARIIFFDPAKIDSVYVSEEEITQYYENNKEDYKKDPSCKIKYIKIPLAPSEEDKNLAKTRIDSIYQVVMEGMDFATAAQEFSEGPSAPKGGDLGYFAQGRMVKEFSDMAFKLAINEVSEPVLTQFGWHIIKVTDKRKNEAGEDEVKASHILIKTEASEKTKENLAIIADDVYNKAIEEGIDAAGAAFAYEVDESREFNESSSYIGGIGQQPNLVKFAFENKVGDVSAPVEVGRGDFIVAEVSEKLGEHYQEIVEVESRIKTTLEKEKKVEVVTAEAETFLAEAGDSDLLTEATAAGWEILEGTDITVDKSLPKIRKDEDFNNAILALEENQFTDLVKGENGAYVAYVTKRVKPDLDVFEKTRESLMAEAQTQAENTHLNEWYMELKETANIEDRRNEYYDL
jgi:parvulin-like peptidyl-prolyl isomerase